MKKKPLLLLRRPVQRLLLSPPLSPAAKRAPSAHQIFLKAEMIKIKAKNPSMKQTDVMKQGNINWQKQKEKLAGKATPATKAPAKKGKKVAEEEESDE